MTYKLPKFTREEVLEMDHKYNVHSWSAQKALKNIIPVEKSEGIYFYDYNGKRYADMCSQLVNMNLGHGNQQIIDAIKEQAEQLCFIAPGQAVGIRAALAKKIVEHAPKGMSRVFFTNGGADSNENAIKMARQASGKQKVLSMYRSYHGATITAGNVSGDSRRFAAEIGGSAPGIVHFFGPFPYREEIEFESEEALTEYYLKMLRKQIIAEGHNNIAAIILETVIGANGVILPPKGYLAGIRALCDEFGIFMICDEVMAGFGRTGTWFAVDNWNVSPDMITFAKGVNSGYVQLGGIIMNEKVASHFDDVALQCGLTYQGHPLACAAAYASMEYIEEHNILDNVQKVGKVLGECLEELAAKHACVGEVRYIGLFSAIDLVKNKETKEPLVEYAVDTTGNQKKVVAKCKELGFYTYGRDNCIQICPPLIITEEELREQMKVLDEVLTWADNEFCK